MNVHNDYLHGSKLAALLIDFDGTLFLTQTANAKAYQEALAFHGHNFPLQTIIEAIDSQHSSVFLPKLTGLPIGHETLKKITEFKKLNYKNHFHLIEENSLLISFLEKIQNQVRLVLVTTAARENVIQIMKAKELQLKFEHIVTSSDVEKTKPEPDPFLKAMELLGVNKDVAIAIDDSESGILSAKRAGLQVLQVHIG